MLSVSGKKWHLPPHRQGRASADALLANILAARGVTAKETEDFLNPKLRTLLPDPSRLLDMQPAVERLTQALLSHENIAIYGDYDVDGATSVALLVRYLRCLGRKIWIHPSGSSDEVRPSLSSSRHAESLGAEPSLPAAEAEDEAATELEGDAAAECEGPEQEGTTPGASEAQECGTFGDVEIYIPDRLSEGYGVNRSALEGILQRGAKLVLMVDCGTTSVDDVAYAKSQGADTLIFDHHVTGPQLPRAVALVNPHRANHPEVPGMRDLCSAGLVFLLLIALQRHLRENHIFPGKLPDLMAFSDLVALGTVCDVMPLRGLNRALVRRGLEKIHEHIRESATLGDLAEELGSASPAHEPTASSPRSLEEVPAPSQESSSGDRKENFENIDEDSSLQTQAAEASGKPPSGTAPLESPSSSCLGLQALCRISGVKDTPSAHHLGFALGPRINAGGRVGVSTLGVELLTTSSSRRAVTLARWLDQLNEKRRLLERQTLQEAKDLLCQKGQESDSCLLVGNDSWHPGVVGIVASRLKEAYGRPCFVAAFQGEVAKGSARSVEGLDIGQLIHAAFEEGCLVGGGGHALAGGFTVTRDKWEVLREFLVEKTKDFMTTYTPSLWVDADLSPGEASLDLLDRLEQLEPIGAGNPPPRFCLREVVPSNVRDVGQRHIQCQLVDEDGRAVKAVAFQCLGTPLEDALKSGCRLFVVGSLVRNTWRQQTTPQFVIEDAAWTR